MEQPISRLRTDAAGRLVLPATLTFHGPRPSLAMVAAIAAGCVLLVAWQVISGWKDSGPPAPGPAATVWLLRGVTVWVSIIILLFPVAFLRESLWPLSEVWTLDGEGLHVARTNMMFRPPSQTWRYSDITAIDVQYFSVKIGLFYRVRVKLGEGGWLPLPRTRLKAEADLVAAALRRLTSPSMKSAG